MKSALPKFQTKKPAKKMTVPLFKRAFDRSTMAGVRRSDL